MRPSVPNRAISALPATVLAAAEQMPVWPFQGGGANLQRQRCQSTATCHILLMLVSQCVFDVQAIKGEAWMRSLNLTARFLTQPALS